MVNPTTQLFRTELLSKLRATEPSRGRYAIRNVASELFCAAHALLGAG